MLNPTGFINFKPMISYKIGNIIESDTEALVNTVNTVGVMGKGIALAFKKAFPIVWDEYKKSVDNDTFRMGKVQVVKTNTLTPKYVINFPTKKHWRHPSRIEYIENGLNNLIGEIIKYNIKSISIPPLGCGNGKLEWGVIKPLLEKKLNKVAKNIEIVIFEPGYSDQKMIQKKDVKLTQPRAMLVYLLKQYQVLGYSINLLVAQKLAYFLQRFGEPLNLHYEKGYYGPYAHRLLHLLKFLNGYYIWFRQDDNKPGSTIKVDLNNYPKVEIYFKNNVTSEQKLRVDKVLNLIEGFESPYGLELLATVDFIMQETKTSELNIIKNDIYNWTNRKRNIMKSYHIEVATKQIKATCY